VVGILINEKAVEINTLRTKGVVSKNRYWSALLHTISLLSFLQKLK
jgi:hypothetical protein